MLLNEVTPLITTAMVQPVADQVLSALPVIATVGISIFGVIVAYRMIPKFIRMFAK